ncbi:hypothetical protein ACGFNU_05955 [Spirillospora sp. NPDC048911]|uniref:hypothetical protein n=1 Tax=Spirillospora sp. NPDC048911 TaxID=3364527 RepID=UPI0037244BBE
MHAKPPAEPDLLEVSPFKGDLDAELAAQPRSRALPGPTVYLGAGVLLVAGFLGGIQAEKVWSDGDAGQPATAQRGYGGGQRGFGGAPPGYGGAQPGSGGQRGFGGPGNGTGTAGGLTTGTVVKIVGTTVYLRTADGKTVKVKTSGATKVQVTRTGSVNDLKSGTSIIVRGSAGTDGTVTATSVNQGGSFRP